MQVCNKGLRDMLRGDAFKVERFKDELSELGNHFGQQGHKQGATFIYVLYKVAEHVLPAEHENLRVWPSLDPDAQWLAFHLLVMTALQCSKRSHSSGHVGELIHKVFWRA